MCDPRASCEESPEARVLNTRYGSSIPRTRIFELVFAVGASDGDPLEVFRHVKRHGGLHLRRSIAGLLIGMVFFLGFESGQLVATQQIHVLVFAYVVGLIAPLSVIFAARLWRRLGMFVPILFWCIVYFLGKFVVTANYALPQVAEAQALSAEIVLLGILVGSAWKLGKAMRDVTDLIQSLPFGANGGSTRAVDQASPEVDFCMLQSRRFGRPLGMVVIEPEAGTRSAIVQRCRDEIERAITRRFTDFKLATVLDSNLRRADLLLRGAEDGFVVLCPESDAQLLNGLVERIEASVPEKLGVPVACGTATFPNDAVTLDLLKERARADLKQRRSGSRAAQESSVSLRNRANQNSSRTLRRKDQSYGGA